MNKEKKKTYFLRANIFEGERLDKALALLCPELSRTQLKRLVEEGRVQLNRAPLASVSHKIRQDDLVVISIPAAKELSLEAEAIPLNIIYEDQDILVLNKPAGLVVHPGAGNETGTLVQALLHHCGEQLSGIGGVKRPGIVHRLDKDTSGLLVVAKNDTSHQHLMGQLKNKTMKREYVAFVLGCPLPLEGTIRGNIGRSYRNRQKMARLNQGGKEAITHYQVQEIFTPERGRESFAAKVLCSLETGRTHQIRVHLADSKHPVIGDPVYGNTQDNKVLKRLYEEKPNSQWQNKRQALHAQRLTLVHPRIGEEMMFEAPLPPDMQDLEESLKNDF